jgi:hypothetical protein
MQEMRRGCEVTVRRCGRSDKGDDGGDYICGSYGGGWWSITVVSFLALVFVWARSEWLVLDDSGRAAKLFNLSQTITTQIQSRHLASSAKPITQHNSRPLYAQYFIQWTSMLNNIFNTELELTHRMDL